MPCSGLLREEPALDQHLDGHAVEVDGGFADGPLGIRRLRGPLAHSALHRIGGLLQFVERGVLPPGDGIGQAIERDGRRGIEVARDVISHGVDATAVRAWAEVDPVLSRIGWPPWSPRVCLVGGAVRDALLGITHGPDVDLVVEGDAIAVAREIGHALAGSVIAHPRFGTARVELPHGRHLDLVTARREVYAHPGALPDVEPGDLQDDLARRDFTINAIAFVLHGDGAGGIIDPHDGRSDLESRTVRLIRPGAFAEDPSRVVRAARYAARLAFQIDPSSRAEARACADAVTLDSSRVAEEATRLLAEDTAAAALRLAEDVGVAWPDTDPERDRRLAEVPGALSRPGAPTPAAWALRLGLGVRPDATATAALPAWSRAEAEEVRTGVARASELQGQAPPSYVDRILHGMPPAAQVGALIGGAEAVARWWAEWRDATPAITGADLVDAGIRPGPAIGRALAAVRAAVLDGSVGDRDAQLALALAEAGGGR